MLLAAGFAWVVTTQGPLAAVKVTLGKASTGLLQNAVFGVGTLEARHSYNLAPTITSRVSRVLVDQGDQVRAGQLLAEMDAVDLNDRVTSSQQAAERSQYAIRVAEAQLAEAQSRVQNRKCSLYAFCRIARRAAMSARKCWMPSCTRKMPRWLRWLRRLPRCPRRSWIRRAPVRMPAALASCARRPVCSAR